MTQSSQRTGHSAEHARTDAGPISPLRGAPIIHVGSLNGDEWDISNAAEPGIMHRRSLTPRLPVYDLASGDLGLRG
jgi:hypothetical protein